jgi:hypothetical protein
MEETPAMMTSERPLSELSAAGDNSD